MTYRVLVQGNAAGQILRLDEPLSFWGGFDPQTGLVIDVTHPQVGEKLSDRIVAMRSGRGSSSASTVLSEAMRRGTAPSALILSEIDPILVIGSLVGQRLYDISCPVLLGPLPRDGVDFLIADEEVRVDGQAI